MEERIIGCFGSEQGLDPMIERAEEGRETDFHRPCGLLSLPALILLMSKCLVEFVCVYVILLHI